MIELANSISNIVDRIQTSISLSTKEAMRLLFLLATFSLVLALPKKPTVTEKAILDIEIGGKNVGQIVIGLFGKIVPKTVKNFVELCKRPYLEGYKGSKFHFVSYVILIAGYINVTDDGYITGVSIYGEPFERENFILKHYGVGWVSMENTRSGHNNIVFSIDMQKNDEFDDKKVVFGKVIRGMDVAWQIEEQDTDRLYRSIKDVVIADCKVEVAKRPFLVEKTDAIE